jgi:hypothetical protein
LNLANLLFFSVLHFSQIKHIMNNSYKRFHNFTNINYLVTIFYKILYLIYFQKIEKEDTGLLFRNWASLSRRPTYLSLFLNQN